jgi:hypothetical protein
VFDRVGLDQERRDRLAGVGLAVLGVVVLALAIMAIRSPGTQTNGSERFRTSQAARLSTTSAHSGGAASRASSAAPSAHPAVHSSGPSSPGPGSSSSTTAATDGISAAKQVPLIVLNNTSTTGLAAGAEARFEANGWTVTHIDTLRDDIASTCAYYDPASPGAKEAAEELQAEFPAITRVAPRFAQLPQGPVVVVLTWDYKAG